jgi:hypothetical protein
VQGLRCLGEAQQSGDGVKDLKATVGHSRTNMPQNAATGYCKTQAIRWGDPAQRQVTPMAAHRDGDLSYAP